MKSWCVVFVANQMFWNKINLKRISKPFTFRRYTRNFVAKAFYSQTLFTYYIHISKPLDMYARERLSRQGETYFLTSKLPKNNSYLFKYKLINRTTSSRSLFSVYLSFNHCRLLFHLSPRVGLGMHRKMPNRFFHSSNL